jgi:hypothetical protein
MCARLISRMALVCLIGLGLIPEVAQAIDADVARKCEAATYNALPLSVPGNPAVSKSDRLAPGPEKYFRDCIAKGGKIDGALRSGPRETTGAAPARTTNPEVPLPDAVERSPYRPCPAEVSINGRNMCLGTPDGGYDFPVKGTDPEPTPYRPCPASVGFKGKTICLG